MVGAADRRARDMWILVWFSRLPYQRTDEETVEEAIAQEAAEAVHA